MATLDQTSWRLDAPAGPRVGSGALPATQIILSFDVEEHFRIEAAAGVDVPPAMKEHYGARLDTSTRWVLDELARHEIKATFFVVGAVAHANPSLIRAIHQGGHEVASHSWEHRRIHTMTPASFREDVQKSKDVLEDVTGAAVVGYRAPTFSIVRQTAWALEVLVELGMVYDSSIYPVHHDRYGVPDAPRAPFVVRTASGSMLEFPPATLRVLGVNVPTGGGGYFRLLPLFLMERTLRQTGRNCVPPVAMLYFHPWEFDPEQPRLAMGLRGRLRTYVGMRRTRGRLACLLARHTFARAIDLARQLQQQWSAVPSFDMAVRQAPEQESLTATLGV